MNENDPEADLLSENFQNLSEVVGGNYLFFF